MAQVPSEETFEGAGGTRIFFRSWRPDAEARGVVIICHGFNAHGGQYSWVAGKLLEDGLAVYALDLRGRGQSGGERFYVEDAAEYVDDVARLVVLAKTREPGLPVFLLGHSAGGVISCAYSVAHQAELAGLICESFAFQVPAPDFALAAIKGLSLVAPRLPVLKLHNEDFSRDPQAVQALDADPLIADEVEPARTVAAMIRADERLKRDFPLMTLPVLIMHGTRDKATLPRGSQFMFDHVGSRDKTLKLYDGHYHDLFNDLGREAVMEDTRGWILDHLTPPTLH